MRQRAKVTAVNGPYATVEVKRSTMCDGCEKSGGCGGHCAITGIVGDSRPMTARAVNLIGAKTGDLVEVESEEKVVLGSAALVFLVPLAVCALFFFLGTRIFGSEGAGVVSAAAGFVLAFLAIGLYDRKLAGKAPRIRIVALAGADGTDVSGGADTADGAE